MVPVKAVPFQNTLDPIVPFTKPLPVTDNWNAAPPAVAELGMRPFVVAMAGCDWLIVNWTELDVAVPVCTLTSAEPGVATWVAGTMAVRWLESVNVVVKGDVPQYTTEVAW